MRACFKDWLRLMACHIEDGIDMVMGYSNYNDEASDYQRYERAMMQRQLLKEAEKTAYRTEGHNLLFRKDMFMNGRGFDGNTQFVRGEYDFLVNKYAERGNTATEQSPEALAHRGCTYGEKMAEQTPLLYVYAQASGSALSVIACLTIRSRH